MTGRRRATRCVFFIAGFAVAAWAPLVPFAKQRLGIDDRALGALLLCIGAGSIIAMPPSGLLVRRFGCRAVIAASTLLACAALPLLATLARPLALAAVLVAFGAAVGSLDAAMNTQAIIVERESGRRLMSGFHGLYSVGGIAGAAGMTVLLKGGATPSQGALCVVGGIVLALAAALPGLLRRGPPAQGPRLALPHGGVLLFIGVLCLVMFLAEGAVLDWSAVFLASVRGVAASLAGSGYAVFALAMTIGRLTGDRMVHRLGGARVILCGGACAAAGFVLATLGPGAPAALAGFALVGAGCANIVPVLFTSAGRQGVPEDIAVPAITTLGYAGILAGPGAIGFVAHAAGLPAAFLMLALLLGGVAVGGQFVRA